MANIIDVSNLTKSFTGRKLFREASFSVQEGEKIGYYSQEIRLTTLKDECVIDGNTASTKTDATATSYMNPKERVIDYIKNTVEYVKTADGLVSASAMLERFLFPPEEQYGLIEKLSGGERRRLNLLRVLMEAPNVLILDVNWSTLFSCVSCV